MMYTDPSGESFLPFLFVAIGAYVGGAAANDWKFNPFKWKYNFSTFGSMLLGGITGALGGQSMAGFFKGSTPLSVGVNANNVITSFANFSLKGGKFLLNGVGYATAAGGGVYLTKSALSNSNKPKQNLNNTREYIDIPNFEDGNNFSTGKKYARELQSYYENGLGVDYVISRERLFDIYNKALHNDSFNWDKAKYLGNYIYSVPTNLYKTDYALSFGRATMKIYLNPKSGTIYPVGFYDRWDLDPKPWGKRSYPAEILTRYYYWTLKGLNFDIRYP